MSKWALPALARGHEPQLPHPHALVPWVAHAYTRLAPPLGAPSQLQGADVIYTDVWASMGQKESIDERKRDFVNYQVRQ